MKNKYFPFCILLFSQITFLNAGLFSQPTYTFKNYSDKIKTSLSGFMTSFADFDADRMVDVIILDKTANQQHVDVILMNKDDSSHPTNRINLFNDTTNSIRNIVTGDFNGDSILDIVCYHSEKPGGPYNISTAYGQRSSTSVSPPVAPGNISFLHQPLHLDWNSDMIGDLFGQSNTPNREFIVLYGTHKSGFITHELPELSEALRSRIDRVTSAHFVDLNQDSNADILLVAEKSSHTVLVSLLKTGSLQFTFDRLLEIELPLPIVLGVPVLGDFMFEGATTLLIQLCMSASGSQLDVDMCIDSRLLLCRLYAPLWNRNTCKLAQFDPIVDGIRYRFETGSAESRLSLDTPKITTMSCGDLQATGHVGCLVSMTPVSSGGPTRLWRLHNSLNMQFSLTPLEDVSGRSIFTNVTQAAIFDLMEDGIPDILVVHKDTKGNGLISPLIQDTSRDAYFLKVMVLNGLCGSANSCPNNRLPFGIPLPGTSVNYSTEGIDGKQQYSMVSIMPSSTYTPLLLPYAFFGLSTFSNYIEKLDIQLPSSTVTRTHTLTFIVPKTQIVIIPYPLDEPSRWSNKLFIEPFSDKKVLWVAAALLGTMFVVSIILCILQYLEVREDRQEKMQEAQKFNFDAM